MQRYNKFLRYANKSDIFFRFFSRYMIFIGSILKILLKKITMEEKDVRTRINEVMQAKGLNPRQVSGSDVNFYAKSYLQLAKGKTLTLPIILALLEKVPDLSAEWLFRGTGRPFLTDQADEQSPSPTPAIRSSVIPQATANGDGAIAIAGDWNVTIPKQILDILAEKDRQLAEKDDIIKHYIMRR